MVDRMKKKIGIAIAFLALAALLFHGPRRLPVLRATDDPDEPLGENHIEYSFNIETGNCRYTG